MKIEHFDKLCIVSCGLFRPDLQNGNAELTIINQNIGYSGDDFKKLSVPPVILEIISRSELSDV